MTQEALKLALDFIEDVNFGEWRGSTERQEKAIISIKEALAKEKALQALHDDNERLGLYKDAYAQPKPQIKTTDPFESSRVGDYNRGWNDCLFASGIVKQPEQEPVTWGVDWGKAGDISCVSIRETKVDQGVAWLCQKCGEVILFEHLIHKHFCKTQIKLQDHSDK